MLSDVIIDGTTSVKSSLVAGTGNSMTYTFNNVTGNHTITASFILYGDVDGDGEINTTKDGVRLSQYCGGWNVEINQENADLDTNGKVDLCDAEIFKWYAAGWNVTLPYTEECIVVYVGESTNEYQTFTPGATVTLSQRISHEDYILKGWSKTPGGAQDYALDASYVANENMVLYPVWEAKCTNCGNAAHITACQVECGGTITVGYADPDVYLEGCCPCGRAWSGYSCSNNCGYAGSFCNVCDPWQGSDTFDCPNSVYCYTKTYLITFNANGGKGIMYPQVVGTTSTVLTANTFGRPGYTFGGWNTSPNGTGTTYSDGASYTATSNITLYAIWTAN